MHNGSSSTRLSKRNFVLGVVNGGLGQFSGSLVDPGTVLAVFVLDLVPGRQAVIWLGLLVSLINAGWFWPAALLAGKMATLERRQPYYQLSAVLRVFAVFGLWVLVARLGGGRPILLLTAIALIQLAISSAGGIGLMPFFSVVTDTIPANWRGKFFGARTFVGSLLAFIAGFWVKHLLAAEGERLWDSYSLLFLASAIFGSVSFVAWSLAREAEHPVQRRQLPFRLQLWRGPRAYRRDTNFRRIVQVRVLTAFAGSLAFPFVVPYVLQYGLAGKSLVGAFLAATVLGRTASNIPWSHISDRRGNRLLLLISGGLSALLPVAVLLTPLIPRITLLGPGSLVPDLTVAYLLALFVLIGASQSGMEVGQTNYLLEVAPTAKRTTYLGFYYTVLTPASFAPLVGALIIGTGNYYMLGFGLAALLGLWSVASVVGMDEVRWGAQAAEDEGEAREETACGAAGG
jgi:MFS family permease